LPWSEGNAASREGWSFDPIRIAKAVHSAGTVPARIAAFLSSILIFMLCIDLVLIGSGGFLLRFCSRQAASALLPGCREQTVDRSACAIGVIQRNGRCDIVIRP